MKRSGAGGLNESIESFFGNDLLGRPLGRFERTIKRAVSFARESDLYPQSRVVYRVVKLREDSLQLPRRNPAVQQQARLLLHDLGMPRPELDIDFNPAQTRLMTRMGSG